jgi:poly(A) polymerase
MATRKPLPSISDAPWLSAAALQALLRAIADAGGEARVAGGAVHNHLMGRPVNDIDIASTLPPDQLEKICRRAGYAVHPVGIEHGTIVVVIKGHTFEVTTLRKDVETDGRRAKVKFTDDWQADAMRRDFTINAMYADAAGNIYDFAEGYKDIQTRRVRFVGKAEERIREDYLRILRFFRFHARYGKGRAPDRIGLAACTKLKAGLRKLSAERIRQEMLKLLEAEHAVPTLKIMARSGILKALLPHTEDWRVLDRLPRDGLMRLMLLTKQPRDLKAQMRLSNDEGKRIARWLNAPSVSPKLRDTEQRSILYQIGAETWRDAVATHWAQSRASKSDPAWQSLADLPALWQPPKFPLNGNDLIQHGLAQGPGIGAILRQLEDHWIASDFKLDKQQLLEMAHA